MPLSFASCRSSRMRTRGLNGLWPISRSTNISSKALDQWAWENGLQLDFTRSGKPTYNEICESFNGKLRDECLNANEFASIDQGGKESKLVVSITMIIVHTRRTRPSDPESKRPIKSAMLPEAADL